MAKGKYHKWLTAEGLLLLQGWARDGLSEEQIAGNIGISRQTLSEWKRRFPSISDTLREGKDVVDRQVENALLKRALGYQFKEVTVEVDEEGNEKIKTVTKTERPDVNAQMNWLRFRKPEQWRQLSPYEKEKLENDKRNTDLREQELKNKHW